MTKIRVEWAWTRRVNPYGWGVGIPIKVRVLARRGKWAWVQDGACEPFTTKQTELLHEQPEEEQ